MSNKNKLFSGFSSVAIHGGHDKDPSYAHLTPIYASSTYVFDEAEQGMRRFAGEEKGYLYGRWGNPNTTEAEDKIAALEGFGVTDENGNPIVLKAILHASGMAAISTMLIATLKAGDKILSHYSLYGGTQQLIEIVLAPLGIEVIIIDFFLCLYCSFCRGERRSSNKGLPNWLFSKPTFNKMFKTYGYSIRFFFIHS